MTDSDERLLTASKLRELAKGRLDDDERVHSHVGLIENKKHRANLSFLESEVDNWPDGDLAMDVRKKLLTETATEALYAGLSEPVAALLGVTEKDLEADQVRLVASLLEEIAGETLSTILAAGDPNSGKTNTVWLLVEIAKARYPDLVVLSNARASAVDERCTSAHQLAVSLLEHRDRPTAVVVDEGSTHFDARTNSYEVATQWSPLHKRMSKLSTELVAVIGHSGKDVCPEAKRLTSLALWKTEPEVAEFFAEWPADSDRPDDRLFGGPVDDLEATAVEYDPDEPAPWSWDLQADLFDEDLDWSELLAELKRRGPDES